MCPQASILRTDVVKEAEFVSFLTSKSSTSGKYYREKFAVAGNRYSDP